MKALFWVPYPTDGPSNRFRVEQYLPYLKDKGILYSLRPFWSKEAYKILYEKGSYLRKAYYFIKGTLNRLYDLIHLSDYSLIFIHREAYPIGLAFLERIASRRKKIIYDFDDSVFLPNFSSTNKIIHFLKNHRKTPVIIKISSAVIAGNNYLEEYASNYNRDVTIIPTPIDTDLYSLSLVKRHVGKVIIGWIGTYSTNQYLFILKNVFSRLIDKYGESIEIRLIGCKYGFLAVFGICYRNWSLSSEVEDLQDLDIGVMPVWDDGWTRGKCAFKIIQYMATGAAVAASPVGMNREIIIDGENGFLATDEDDWFGKLCLLIDNPEKRRTFAINGRQTIEGKYSLRAIAPKFVGVLERVYGDKR